MLRSTTWERRYGGRRPFLRHVAARMRVLVGGWRRERNVNWRTVRRVVFVCAGNVCRSPYAEARALALGLQAASCGITAINGASADPTAFKVAAARRVDLGAHRSRSYADFEMDRGDLLVLFDPEHLQALTARPLECGVQVTFAGLWKNAPNPYIADPFGRSDEYFHRCFDMIDAALEGIRRNVARQPQSVSSLAP